MERLHLIWTSQAAHFLLLPHSKERRLLARGEMRELSRPGGRATDPPSGPAGFAPAAALMIRPPPTPLTPGVTRIRLDASTLSVTSGRSLSVGTRFPLSRKHLYPFPFSI